MRYIYLALIILFTTAILTFTFQNLGMTILKFLNMRVEMPVSLLVIVVYIFGMLTGGSLMMLVRHWIGRARIGDRRH